MYHLHNACLRSNLVTYLSSRPPELVRRLKPEEIIKYTEDGSILERINLDGEHFISNHGWMSISGCKESIRYSSGIGEIHASFNPERAKNRFRGVSFGGVMMMDPYPCLDFVYYGEDEDDLLHHLSSHIKHTLSVCKHNNIPISITHPFGLDRVKLGKIFTEGFRERAQLSKSRAVEDIPTVYMLSQRLDTSKL